MLQNLKDLNYDELVSFFIKLGEKKFRAQQVFRWLYEKNAQSIDDFTNISLALREQLKKKAFIGQLKLVHEQNSQDGTRKLLFALEDRSRIESVLLFDADRCTLCASTQVGCSMNCAFCKTATLKKKRNLKAWEIVDQFAIADQLLQQQGKRLTNSVLMGMGEPLDNFDEVIKALYLLKQDSGLQFSPRRITLSTCGLVPKIYALADDPIKVKLAVSLNASTNEQRNKIMPINRRYPIEDLLKAAKYYAHKKGFRTTFEYVLIGGINDSLEDAHRLHKHISHIPCKINLIPYNPVSDLPWQAPLPEAVEAFYQFLFDKHHTVIIRKSKGQDISAACGQLAAQKQA